MKIIACCLLLASLFASSTCQQRVLLSSVKSITLHSGKFTTARRGTPILQLQCILALAPCKSLPSTVQCYNKGTDGLDIQWRCEAQLPKSVQFDNTQISCEGFDHPADDYILAGSCGLTYSLKPTSGAAGHDHSNHHHRGGGDFVISSVHATPMLPIVSGVVLVVVLLGLAVLAYRICPCNSTMSSSDDAPPSYYSRTQYKPLGGYAYHQEPSAAAVVTSSGAGGFWTGAAVGGVAGLLVGGGAAAAAAAAASAPSYHAADTCDVMVYASSSDDCSSDCDEYGGGGVATAVGYASTVRR